jgi:putative ABC transport system permease protein
VKPSNALRFYRARLRARVVQECLAVVGIAAGVALLFASQVSSSSLQSSVAQLSHGIDGRATLQLLARDPHGFPQTLLRQVRAIRGVRLAAPLLEVGARAIGPRGSESIELVGADESLSKLGGSLVRHTDLAPFGGVGAVVLTAPLARTVGVTKFGEEVTIQAAGRATSAPLYSQLHTSRIGALSATPIAIAPLDYAQTMANLPGRVSRILVQPATGAQARVRAALLALAAGHLDVESSDYQEKLFAKTAAVSNQSTELFSVISALVGFLFAFNAMLLTVPQRRRMIADLRRDGYTPGTVIAVLLLDAVVLGVIACALGLALGEELSIHLLHSNPAFLSLAFAVGSQRVVGWQSIALAVSGGMLAAIVAVLSPLRDIVSRNPLAALDTKQTGSGATRGGGRRALAGALCVVAATILLRAEPQASMPAMVLLVAALLLELPIALGVTLRIATRLAAQITSAVPHVAAMELRAARARAVAIAATGAVAIFGSVAIQGSHKDLLAGLDGAAQEMNESSQLWVAPAGAYNLLMTSPFVPVERARIASLPGVRAVQIYRNGLLDYGTRRVIVIARPREADPLLPAGQIIDGQARQATQRVRSGGWVVLSQALAAEHHLHVGQAFTLPSPDPTRFRIAALSTNAGWAPGAIIMNATDYAHAWGSQDASAFGILLKPGVPPARAAAEIELALTHGGAAAGATGLPSEAGAQSEPTTGLAVQTSQQHIAAQRTLSREALTRLTQIATLIPIVAVLAMAAAMGAMVWQRRPRLAKLKLEGIARAELWRTILLESLLLVGVGAFAGALFGVYGQHLADRALASVVNFPVVYSVTALAGLESLVLVVATAVAILAIPGYVAACVPAALALQD